MLNCIILYIIFSVVRIAQNILNQDVVAVKEIICLNRAEGVS